MKFEFTEQNMGFVSRWGFSGWLDTKTGKTVYKARCDHIPSIYEDEWFCWYDMDNPDAPHNNRTYDLTEVQHSELASAVIGGNSAKGYEYMANIGWVRFVEHDDKIWFSCCPMDKRKVCKDFARFIDMPCDFDNHGRKIV